MSPGACLTPPCLTSTAPTLRCFLRLMATSPRAMGIWPQPPMPAGFCLSSGVLKKCDQHSNYGALHACTTHLIFLEGQGCLFPQLHQPLPPWACYRLGSKCLAERLTKLEQRWTGGWGWPILKISSIPSLRNLKPWTSSGPFARGSFSCQCCVPISIFTICVTIHRPPLVVPYVWYMRLLKQIEGVLQKMTAEYDKLTVLLSEATVNPALFDGPLGCTIPSLHGCFIVHAHDDHMGSLQGLFGLVQGIGSLRSRRAMSRARSWMYRWTPCCWGESSLDIN